MHDLSIAQLSEGLRQKSFSCVELMQHYLARLDQHNARLNTLITRTDELALAAARKADIARQQGASDPLLGIPIAYKDMFCTAGVRTTCASKMLENFIAPYDATVVERLKQAGLIMLGKTNMDEFAMGSSNENSYFGPVKNPWHEDYVPGGSSGGSAAMVAARLAPIATGSDTGGSVRQPAAFSGITGFKPSYGRVSRYGMVAFASSLDQAGLFGRSAEDIAHVFLRMAGHDPRDSTSVDRPVPDYPALLNKSIKGLKIGLPTEYFNHKLDANLKSILETAMRALEAQGAIFISINLPHTELAIPAYYIIAPAECSANLARFDGVRYGYRCENPKDITDLYERSRQEGFGAEVKRRILIGTYVLQSGYYDAYYRKAQQVRRLITDDFNQAFQQVDVILGPTTPTPAFPLRTKTTAPITMYLSDIYTISVNLAGLPAISVPCGFHQQLPIGMQLIGPYCAEDRLLNVAHQFQLATDWHQKSPAGF